MIVVMAHSNDLWRMNVQTLPLVMMMNVLLLKFLPYGASDLQVGFFNRNRPPTDDDCDDDTHKLKEEQSEYADVSPKDQS